MKIYLTLFLLFLSTYLSAYPLLWQDEQIKKDFAYFENKKISLKAMDDFYERRGEELLLVRVQVQNGKMTYSYKTKIQPVIVFRVIPYMTLLENLVKAAQFPNCTFLMCIGDAVFDDIEEDIPIFVMSKRKDHHKYFMFPDFSALLQEYQVLKPQDVMTYHIDWDKKINKMVWRGSSCQLATDGSGVPIYENNVHLFSRFVLCRLSYEYPHLIDAKFTTVIHGGNLSFFGKLIGEQIPYEKQFHYKYHILVDGNVSSYSTSCWKLFTESVLFKQDSIWDQWYYEALTPYIHYMPVKRDLSDLLEKLHFAMLDDNNAKKMAYKIAEFARNNLSHEANIIYLNKLMKKYAQLKF